MKKIVLTGGPCSGKSTILDALRDEFRGQIQTVPEVATILLTGAFPVPGKEVAWSEGWQALFQGAVRDVQPRLEEAYALKAQQDGRKVLICDRGLIDGASYTPGGLEAFCRAHKVDAAEALSRYDAVIHLESLAVHDPEEYERRRHSNAARFEDLERAQYLERMVVEVWKDHPNRLVLKGEQHFVTKITRAAELVRRILDE